MYEVYYELVPLFVQNYTSELYPKTPPEVPSTTIRNVFEKHPPGPTFIGFCKTPAYLNYLLNTHIEFW